MFGRLSERNDVDVFASLRVSHVHDSAIEKAKQVDALFAVGMADVLRRNHQVIEHCFATREIQPMVSQIRLALVIVPSRHALIVSTKNSSGERDSGSGDAARGVCRMLRADTVIE